jgi:surface carbohydrate biosynthesis protein
MPNILKNRKIKSLIYIFKIFLRAKKLFFKPPKKKFLIIDSMNSFMLEKYLGKKNINILCTRGEEINLYVLLYSLLKINFNDIGLSYINAYIKLTSPKCCISLNHAKLYFYKIKQLNKNLITILIQNGHTHLKYPHDKFLNSIKNENHKFGKKNLTVDYIFSNSSYFSKYLFKKYVNCETIEIGGFRNNYYFKKKIIKKKNVISFISQVRLHGTDEENQKLKLYESEKIIASNLYKFCKKNNFTLEILGSEWDSTKEKNYYKKIIKNNDWIYRKRTKNNYSYYSTDQASIVVGIDSNLVFESLARGNKTIAFNLRHNWHSSYYNFGFNFLKNKGNFWTNYFSTSELNRLMNYAKRTSLKKWKKDNALLIEKIMHYDSRNKKFKKIISNI